MNQKATTITLIAAAVFAVLEMDGASAFSGEFSRRESLQALVGGVATAVMPSVIPVLPANAVVDEETPRVVTRMGGLLVRTKKRGMHLARRCVPIMRFSPSFSAFSKSTGTLSRWPEKYSHDDTLRMEQI
jgi:hypothetical protein